MHSCQISKCGLHRSPPFRALHGVPNSFAKTGLTGGARWGGGVLASDLAERVLVGVVGGAREGA